MNTERSTSRSLLSRLRTLLTLLLVCGAAYLWADCLIRHVTWEHTTATITSYCLEEDLFNGGFEQGAFRVYPGMTFTDARSGESHFFQSPTSYAPDAAPPDGSTVELIYPAGKPQEAQEETFTAQYCLPLSVSLFAAAAILLPMVLKYRCRRRGC